MRKPDPGSAQGGFWEFARQHGSPNPLDWTALRTTLFDVDSVNVKG
jgi:hypothetical protein